MMTRPFLVWFGLSSLLVSGALRAVESAAPGAVVNELAQIFKDRCPSHRDAIDAAARTFSGNLGHGATPELTGATIAALLGQLGWPADIVHHRTDQAFWLYRELKHLPPVAASFPRDGGAWFERRGRRWFVARVFPGGRAARAGIKRGDEIVLEAGAPLPWLKPTGNVSVSVRSAPWSPVLTASLGGAADGYAESWLDAARSAVLVTERSGVAVGYVPLYAAYRETEREWLRVVLTRMERQAKTLVLDLRNGFGGDRDGFLPLLVARAKGAAKGAPPIYSGPLVVMVNRGTRGNLAWLARALQNEGRATLIGGPTGPDYVREESIPFGHDEWLVNVPYFDSSTNACGAQSVPVEPDVRADDPLVYAAGADPLVEDAFQLAVKRLKSSH